MLAFSVDATCTGWVDALSGRDLQHIPIAQIT